MTQKKELGVGILGLGTIGSGVWRLLTENKGLLDERTQAAIRVKKVCDVDLRRKREVTVPPALLTTKAEELIRDPEVDIVVELIGGTDVAGRYILEAIDQGKHVVTANKALLAERGAEIFAAAREKGVSIGFEASVAGGIPILKAIREGFIANRIQEVYGIVNGTANYILSAMAERGADFKEVLRQAQDKGYAEQDPTFDIKGIDAAHKLSILISLCYGVEPPREGLYVEGIDGVTRTDIELARRMGYAVKLLAISKERSGQIEARVHPTMIPLHHPLAEVKGVFNAIFLKGDAVGETMFFGRGAGMMPTASAVVSDIAMVANGVTKAVIPAGGRRASIQPMEDLTSEYYFRFSVVDKPGVLAQIAKHLGDHDISIASVYQPERDAGSKVPIVVMAHEAREKDVQKAITKIDNLETVLDKTVLIRVERFSA